MAEVSNRLHVIRSVAASLITAAVLGIVYAISPWVQRTAAAAFDWIIAPVAMSRLLVSVFLLAFLWLAVARIKLAVSKDEDAEDSIYNYRRDVFFGVEWRWGWDAGGGMGDFIPYCTNCGRMLLSEFDREHGNMGVIVDVLRMKCQGCTWETKMYGDIPKIQNQVYIEVKKKIDDGTWVKVVEKSKA